MTHKRIWLIRFALLIVPLIASSVIVLVFVGGRNLPPLAVSFDQSAKDLDTYDFVEITAHVQSPHASNPFTEGAIRATFMATTGRRWQVEGFCDSEHGSVYRVRFMPSAAGSYSYSIEYRQGWSKASTTGTFHVRSSLRRGPIRIDPHYRWHFLWEGTGEHYFFNGTTAFWLMGWRDDQVILSSIERLHRLKVNRIRMTIAGRTDVYYGEAVMAGPNWTPFLTPWPVGTGQRFLHLVGRFGQRFGFGLGRDSFDSLAGFGLADDIHHPGFDYSRFRVAYWQKLEKALRFARDRDVIFSLVLDMNDSRVHPGPGSTDEHRFIRYAVARLAAFSNITWDLGDDLDQYRDDQWTRATGTLIKQWDPYRHLATSHPVDNIHQDRTSDWFDFTSLQEWSRQQHAFMLAERKQQERLGRIIPQTNEEYGYEDHYPMWAKGPGSETADTLRRMAWEISMAGGYQTTGETARRGTNIWPDTGGGWMNGRGDDTMTMLQGYAHMVDFFTSFDWWKTEPHDELVNNTNYCLAAPGAIYAIYLPRGGRVTVQMQPGRYKVALFNAVTGERTTLHSVDVVTPSWTSPAAPRTNDWALLIEK